MSLNHYICTSGQNAMQAKTLRSLDQASIVNPPLHVAVNAVQMFSATVLPLRHQHFSALLDMCCRIPPAVASMHNKMCVLWKSIIKIIE